MTLALYGKSKTRRAALLGGALLAVLVAMMGALGVATLALAHHTTYDANRYCDTSWDASADYSGGDERRLVLVSNVKINGVAYATSWSNSDPSVPDRPPNDSGDGGTPVGTNQFITRASYTGSTTGLPAAGTDYLWVGVDNAFDIFNRSGGAGTFQNNAGDWAGSIKLFSWSSSSWHLEDTDNVAAPSAPTNCTTVYVKKVVNSGAPAQGFTADIVNTDGPEGDLNNLAFSVASPGSETFSGNSSTDDFTVQEDSPPSDWSLTGKKILNGNATCPAYDGSWDSADNTSSGRTASGGYLDNLGPGESVTVCFKNTYTTPTGNVQVHKYLPGANPWQNQGGNDWTFKIYPSLADATNNTNALATMNQLGVSTPIPQTAFWIKETGMPAGYGFFGWYIPDSPTADGGNDKCNSKLLDGSNLTSLSTILEVPATTWTTKGNHTGLLHICAYNKAPTRPLIIGKVVDPSGAAADGTPFAGDITNHGDGAGGADEWTGLAFGAFTSPINVTNSQSHVVSEDSPTSGWTVNGYTQGSLNQAGAPTCPAGSSASYGMTAGSQTVQGSQTQQGTAVICIRNFKSVSLTCESQQFFTFAVLTRTGGGGTGYQTGPVGYAYAMPTLMSPLLSAGLAIDHNWVQSGTGTVNTSDYLVYDLGAGNFSKEFMVYPSIDHINNPAEAAGEQNEIGLWGSNTNNGSDWVALNHMGVGADPSSWDSDNFPQKWGSAVAYRYIKGDPGSNGTYNDGDAEVDAICALQKLTNGNLIVHKVNQGGTASDQFQGKYDGPGSNDASFTGLTPAAPQTFSVPPGSYLVEEDVTDANSKNYDFLGAFDNGQCVDLQEEGPTSLLVPTPPIYSGGSFDVFAGQDTHVYLCNKPFGKIRIVKNDLTLPGDTSRPANWAFTVAGPSGSTPSIALGGGSVDVLHLPFGTYTVTENASHSSTACPALPNTAQLGYYTTASIPADTTISTPGELITWTFTNTPCPTTQAAPNLSVRKIIDFNGNGAMDGDDYFDNGWTITVTCGSVVMNGNTGANGLGNILFLGTPNGTCTVAETPKAGYSSTVKWDKSDTGANSSGTGSSTTITQDNNDNNAVVFYNQPRVNIHVHKDIVVGGVKSNGNAWTFTLTGCGITPQVKTTTSSGNVDFTDLPPAKGCSYTVTETTQGGWIVSPGPTQTAAPTAGGETANMTFTNTQITGCGTVCAPQTPTTPTTTTTPTTPTATPEKPKEPEKTAIAGERTPGALSTPIAPSAGNGGFGGGSSANIVLAIIGLMAMSGGFAFLALGRKRD